MDRETTISNKGVIVVTGGCGLIGQKVIEKLAKDYTVVGIDKVECSLPHGADNLTFDITSDESVRNVLSNIKERYGTHINSVIHLAAFYDFSGEPSPLYEKVTVRGTERLIEALQDFEVDQFIFSSTNLVYKPTEPGQKINEDWPLDPSWPYPESKVKTEEILKQKHGKIPLAILRVAGVYDDNCSSIPISHQIQRIYEKQFTSHFYPGDLISGNAFIHREDAVAAICKTVEKRNTLPTEMILNISEPETLSYGELQHEIGEYIHGEEWKTYEIPKPLAKAGAWINDLVGEPFIKPWMVDRADDHYELDITRAKEMLDWQPAYSLRGVLPEMISKLKENPIKWYKENDLELTEKVKEKAEAH